MTDETVPSNEKQYISFSLADQDFCVDIMTVREIRGGSKPTPVPHAPEEVLGVINLRGAVIPVVDFSARLGFGRLEEKDTHVTIILAVGARLVGILVEAVCDIITIDDSTIQKTPDLGSERLQTLFAGIATQDTKMIRVVDVQSLLPDQVREFAA